MPYTNVVFLGTNPNDGTGDPLRTAFNNINLKFYDIYYNYQYSNTLAANVATLTSNNVSFVGSVTAANVVSNAQLQANLNNYVQITNLSGYGYQTSDTLAANVAKLTANNANNLGGTPAASYALSAALVNYQTTAGLSANVATLTSNNVSFVGSVTAANVVSNNQLSSNLANYQTSAGLAANVATLIANNAAFIGSIAAASVVSTQILQANLSAYQTSAGLSANVAKLTANNTTYAFGKTEGAINANSALYANASITNTFTVGTSAYHVANGNVGLGGNTTPASPLTVNGVIQSTSGGFKFPDGTTQLTVATGFSNIVVYKSEDAVSNWTIPANVTRFKVTVVGAGGGGGGVANGATGAACGGGGGGTAIRIYTEATPGTTAYLQVGAGGTGGLYAANGGNGADSLLIYGGVTITGGGGVGGGYISSAGSLLGPTFYMSGYGSGGNLNINGSDAFAYQQFSGSSHLGPGRRTPTGVSGPSSPSANGFLYGGGGCGGHVATITGSGQGVRGGYGANGVVIIEY